MLHSMLKKVVLYVSGGWDQGYPGWDEGFLFQGGEIGKKEENIGKVESLSKMFAIFYKGGG